MRFLPTIFILCLASGGFGSADISKAHTNNVFEKEDALQAEIIIFPNPSGGRFYVEISPRLDYSEIRIYNALGPDVAFSLYKNSSRTEFDLSAEPRGMYIVKIRLAGGESIIKKLMIQ